MLAQARQEIMRNLWHAYHDTTPHIRQIEDALKIRRVTEVPLDHLAIIDLPGAHTGIPVLKEIFSILGYTDQGSGYLPEKQNDFVWLAAEDSSNHLAKDALPQVVVADFRPEEMPDNIRSIIAKYSAHAQPAPLKEIRSLVQAHNKNAVNKLVRIITEYFVGRDWPLPTVAEFKQVQAFNELIAWVLVYGRRPNHFTLSVHLMNQFSNLSEFNRFVESTAKLALNSDGGTIKGNEMTGIAQSSTLGITESVALADGTVELPTGFAEFVWRSPRAGLQSKPERWDDYFTGFVAQYANHVIKSLYTDK